MSSSFNIFSHVTDHLKTVPSRNSKFCFSREQLLRADVSKYRQEVYKSEKSKILKKIHKVALGKLLT